MDVKKCAWKKGGKVHAVRNVQSEYVGSKSENVLFVEAFCGRKHELIVSDCELTCKTCIKSVVKAEKALSEARCA